LEKTRADDHHDQEGGDRATDGAKSDIPKNVEQAQLGMKRVEKVIEHGDPK